MSVDHTSPQNLYHSVNHTRYQYELMNRFNSRLDDLQGRLTKHITNSKIFRRDDQNDRNSYVQIEQLIQKKISKIDCSVERNFRSLQEHINENIMDLYSKMKKVEGKMLRIFTQKQQAIGFIELRTDSLEIENKKIRETVANTLQNRDQYKYEGFRLFQQKIKQNEQLSLIKENRIFDQIKLLQEKIKALNIQNLRSIENSAIKKGNQNGVLRQDDFDIDDIKDKIKEIEMGQKQNKRKLISIEDKIKDNKRQIQILGNMNRKIQNLQNQITEARVNWQQKFIQYQQQKKQTGNHNQVNILQTNTVQTEKFQNNLLRNKINRQFGQRRNPIQSYQEIMQQEQHTPQISEIPKMRGGIRGLLQKSKQKDLKETHPKSIEPNSKFKSKPTFNELPRQNKFQSLSQLDYPSNPKSLPPVKSDPKRFRSSIPKNDEESQQDNEQGVFNVDEDGYLMDEDGNYLYDQYGQQLKLDEEDLAQLMRQQNC